VQACILTTFVIVALSTVAFVLSRSALDDVTRATGVDAHAAERAMAPGLTMLSNSLTLVGVLMVGFAAATAFLLAIQLTRPLRELVGKVSALRPGQRAEVTVHTDDEVETLDVAVVGMAERLATVHERQEEEIAARTADLRHQFELDRAILDSIHLGVLTVDLAGTVMVANPAATTLLQNEDVVGKGIEGLVRLFGHRGVPIPGEHVVTRCLREGGVFRTPPSAHWSLERADKSLLPVTVSIVPLHDGEKTFGALVMFQNVTEERHLDYLKSEFITLASHQLRTPLSAIRWYTELLGDARDTLNDEQKGYVDEIDHSVRRMIALLGALLHAARLEDETVRPALSSVDIVALVQDTLKDSAELFEGSGIQHDSVLPAGPINVKTDPVLLRVVLQNLLSNAVKYSPQKTPVTLRLVTSGASVTIAVDDHGIGIPKADQERIFEKFFRAKNVKQMDTDGNGLGLAICKSIVDRIGGTLSFVSEEGKGTTFTVVLPVEKA
jgi:signal transduction histidine kinase